MAGPAPVRDAAVRGSHRPDRPSREQRDALPGGGLGPHLPGLQPGPALPGPLLQNYTGDYSSTWTPTTGLYR